MGFLPLEKCAGARADLGMAVAPALGNGTGNAGRLRAGRIGKYRHRRRLSTPDSRPRNRGNRLSTIYSAARSRNLHLHGSGSDVPGDHLRPLQPRQQKQIAVATEE
jgi:hypothetical protein